MINEFDHKYIASLVTRVQNDDSDAFAELYALTYNKVYNYARHYLRDDFLSQDAVQEAFILVLRNIKSLEDPSLFIAWLNQISFHVCYDMCKKNSKSYGDITDPELLDILCDDTISHNPESNAVFNDEIETLRAAIDDLPSHEKQCIVLRYYNNMKIEDIAATLSISRSSVKRYLISGRKHLAAAIGQ